MVQPTGCAFDALERAQEATERRQLRGARHKGGFVGEVAGDDVEQRDLRDGCCDPHLPLHMRRQAAVQRPHRRLRGAVTLQLMDPGLSLDNFLQTHGIVRTSTVSLEVTRIFTRQACRVEKNLPGWVGHSFMTPQGSELRIEIIAGNPFFNPAAP